MDVLYILIYVCVWKISIGNYGNIYSIHSFEKISLDLNKLFKKKMLKSTYDFDRSIINHAVHTSTYGTSDNKVFLLPKKTKQDKTKQNSSNQSYKNKIVRCHTLFTVHEAFSNVDNDNDTP